MQLNDTQSLSSLSPVGATIDLSEAPNDVPRSSAPDAAKIAQEEKYKVLLGLSEQAIDAFQAFFEEGEVNIMHDGQPILSIKRESRTDNHRNSQSFEIKGDHAFKPVLEALFNRGEYNERMGISEVSFYSIQSLIEERASKLPPVEVPMRSAKEVIGDAISNVWGRIKNILPSNTPLVA